MEGEAPDRGIRREEGRLRKEQAARLINSLDLRSRFGQVIPRQISRHTHHTEKPMTDVHGVARDQLRAFIERIERLEEEKK